jgi:hypothetical protein
VQREGQIPGIIDWKRHANSTSNASSKLQSDVIERVDAP